ncbi:hypothetical protein TNCV_2149061 [Trichonephila clavipes]|nr:hypothetical protein TNCV_2149061 [Trichonephila clavipes]
MSRRSSLVFAFLKAFPASKMPGKSWKNLRNSAIAEINPLGRGVFLLFFIRIGLRTAVLRRLAFLDRCCHLLAVGSGICV